MLAVLDQSRIERYGNWVREMMKKEVGEESEFDSNWIVNHGWKVVPVESMARIPIPAIPHIVEALKNAGCTSCIALLTEAGYLQDLRRNVETEPPSYLPTCYELEVSKKDFVQLNEALGMFRFVLTGSDRKWAISCTESYNLFAGLPTLLEALLNKPIDKARRDYLAYAELLESTPDAPLHQMARRYASM